MLPRPSRARRAAASQFRRRRRGALWSAAVAACLFAANGVCAQSSGEELYLQYCAACHRDDGKGIPGIFPPLAGNPDVTTEDPKEIQDYLKRIIFGYHGALIINNEMYTGRMPPIGYFGRLNESELLDLVNYLRTAWGNAARPITFSELAAARTAGRP